MSQVSSDDLKNMDIAFQGQPFVQVPAKASIDLTTMDVAFQAQPLTTNPTGDTPPVTPTYNAVFFGINF